MLSMISFIIIISGTTIFFIFNNAPRLRFPCTVTHIQAKLLLYNEISLTESILNRSENLSIGIESVALPSPSKEITNVLYM